MKQSVTEDTMSFAWAGGFTLLELLITLLVVAIVTAIGVPSLNTLLSRRYLDQATSEFSRGLFLARSEAAKRAAPVRFRPAADGDWSSGWEVVADSDRDGDYTDSPVFVGEPLRESIRVEERPGNQVSDGHLTFGPTGSITPVGDRLDLIFRDGDCQAPEMYALRVFSSGEIERGEVACETE